MPDDSNNNSVAMMSPDGSSVKMVPPDQVDAFSAQGAKRVSKMISPDGNLKWVPNDQLEQHKKAGGTLVNDDGSFVVSPLEGENFLDTMKRAANAGKSVTPELIKSQTKKGLKEAPIVLASAPAIGASGTAALAGLGEAGSYAPKVAKAVLEHVKEPGQVFKFPYGRAVEYYLLGKMGFSNDAIKKIAAHLPLE